MALPKFLEHIVILCFERRFSKQNSVIRPKANILAPCNIFAPPKFLGWLRHRHKTQRKLSKEETFFVKTFLKIQTDALKLIFIRLSACHVAHKIKRALIKTCKVVVTQIKACKEH